MFGLTIFRALEKASSLVSASILYVQRVTLNALFRVLAARYMFIFLFVPPQVSRATLPLLDGISPAPLRNRTQGKLGCGELSCGVVQVFIEYHARHNPLVSPCMKSDVTNFRV